MPLVSGISMVARTIAGITCFLVGAVSTRLFQAIAWIALSGHPSWYYAAIEVLKNHFLTLITLLTAIVSPCQMVITFRKRDVPETTNFRVDASGNLISSLSPKAVYLSNHQIYVDWLFFWFLSYTANLSHGVYVVVKEQLSRAPLVGQGMLNFRFLFLLRRWEDDKVRMTNQLLEIDAEARGYGPALAVRVAASAYARSPDIRVWPHGESDDPRRKHPYQLIIFPEGTVMSPHTRERSDKYLNSFGCPPLSHVLLPRIRGAFLALRLLRKSAEVVYDVTFGYHGLTAADYGEQIFTLKAMFLMGRGPKKVHLHIRSFAIADIPLGDDDDCVDVDQLDPILMKNFEEWLFGIWYEKDQLMAQFFETGSFVDPDDATAQSLTADFKARSVSEYAVPFMTLGAILLALYWVAKSVVVLFAKCVYNALQIHRTTAYIL